LAVLHIILEAYSFTIITFYVISITFLYLILKWETCLKQKPYHPQQTGVLSPLALDYITNIPPANLKEIRDLAVFVLLTYMGLRSQDVTYILSKDIVFVKHSSLKAPRHYKFVLDKTKNDPDGSGPFSGRTFCHCALFAWRSLIKSSSLGRNLSSATLFPVSHSIFNHPFCFTSSCSCSFKVLRSLIKHVLKSAAHSTLSHNTWSVVVTPLENYPEMLERKIVASPGMKIALA
jgi:hypothetical protein